jgi:hypothetical protein
MQISSFGSKKLAPGKKFKLAPDFQNWHLSIFLAPTFWEPEQPLTIAVKIITNQCNQLY